MRVVAVRQLSTDGRTASGGCTASGGRGARLSRNQPHLLHLLTLQNLPLSVISRLFVLADAYVGGERTRKLSGKLIVNIFFETSTRTRAAFEATAKQLGADVVNLDRVRMSGETKRESLSDTVRTVAAMGAAGIVLRHGADGAAEEAAKAAPAGCAVINGGDGCNAHPTQGLTDAYTLRARFGEDFSRLKVAIVGDVLHSRVARSNLHILRLLGAKDIRLVGPPALCPPSLAEQLGAPVTANMDEGVDGADVVMLLRVQHERLGEGGAAEVREYFANYGMGEERLKRLKKKKEVVLMHPGPINRGVEISEAVADGKNSLILEQVKNGMAIRTAVLLEIFGR